MSTGIPRLPIDKHDHEALHALQEMAPTLWRHLIPELLTWLQDRNWPIYTDVRCLMVRYAHETIEPLKCILDTGDDDIEWQVNCIALISEFPVGVKQALKASVLALQGRVSKCNENDYDVRQEIETALHGCC